MELNIVGKIIKGISLKTFDNSVKDIEEVLFEFENETLNLIANQEDDSIQLSKQYPSNYNAFIKATVFKHPIDRLFNKKVIWHWQLTNNQGYIDGFQLRIDSQLEFQFLVEGSFIRISELINI